MAILLCTDMTILHCGADVVVHHMADANERIIQTSNSGRVAIVLIVIKVAVLLVYVCTSHPLLIATRSQAGL